MYYGMSPGGLEGGGFPGEQGGEKGEGEWEFWRRPARGALKGGPAAIGDQV